MNDLRRRFASSLFFAALAVTAACAAPKGAPPDLGQIRSPEELGLKSRQAYQDAKQQPEKKEKLKGARFGISYADKCLASEPKNVECLYYRVLNTGLFIKNHIPNYQKGLRQMVTDCETLIGIQADYERGGCYRILGNIYAQAPGFSLNPKNITQDLDKSVEYLQEAVRVAPNEPLNHLFLARSLLDTGDKEQAMVQLKEFDRLKTDKLDSEYPEWKEDREKLARKLLPQKTEPTNPS
jgi:tetratricopeptide (TPR) repeat protein